MPIDSSSAVAAVGSGATDPSFAVGVLRKAQNAQRLQGAEALRLIEEAGPQSTKTDDGHISVLA